MRVEDTPPQHYSHISPHNNYTTSQSSSLLRVLGIAIALVLAFHWYIVLHHVNFHHHATVPSKSSFYTGRSPSKEVRPLLTRNTTSNINVVVDDRIIGGEFCEHCPYSEADICKNRIEYMVKQYKISAEEAQGNSDVVERCMAPHFYDNVTTYTEEDEPSVIIHAGPHKTGTTALQAFIYDHVFKNETMFKRDNIRIPLYDELPGVFGKEGVMLNLPHCSLQKYKRSGGQMNSNMCDRMRHAFPIFMHEAHYKREDVLLIAEDFDRIAINNERLRFYLQPYKNIKVVVLYRRLHDWLPSFYNQIVDHYSLVYAAGEQEYPSLVQWLNKNYEEFLDAHSIHVAERYKRQPFVKSVDVINMHEVIGSKVDLIQHFFCNELKANATCEAIHAGAKTSKSNIGHDHDYERLAIKAYLAGKMHPKTSLRKPVYLDRATRGLKMKVDRINAHKTLPRICPPKELLDRMLQTEIDSEKKYFPEWFVSQGGEEKLRQEFDMAVKNKFCILDDDKIFESGVLDSIFSEFAGDSFRWLT